MIGEILSERPSLKETLSIHTKANPFTPENGFKLTPESINWQLQTSLQSMKCSSIDLYYLHAPGDSPSFYLQFNYSVTVPLRNKMSIVRWKIHWQLFKKHILLANSLALASRILLRGKWSSSTTT